MKIIFEGEKFANIVVQMNDFLKLMGGELPPAQEKVFAENTKRKHPGRPPKDKKKEDIVSDGISLPTSSIVTPEVVSEEPHSHPVTKETLQKLMQSLMEKERKSTDTESAIMVIRNLLQKFDATGLSQTATSTKPLDPKLYGEFKKALEEDLAK